MSSDPAFHTESCCTSVGLSAPIRQSGCKLSNGLLPIRLINQVCIKLAAHLVQGLGYGLALEQRQAGDLRVQLGMQRHGGLVISTVLSKATQLAFNSVHLGARRSGALVRACPRI